MRLFKVMAIVLGTTLLVTGLCASMAVMAAPLDATRFSPTNDPTPAFTRFVTITVETGVQFQPTLNSVWQQTILDFPVGTEGFTNTVVLPTDATVITASIDNGDFSIIGTSIQFRLSPGPTDLGWSYRTGQQVMRIGNQYQIDQSVASNNFYRYIGTILFPGPYQYVGSIAFTPQLVTTDTVQWDLIVPQNPSTGQHEFKVSSWLGDPRLTKPDLEILTATLQSMSLNQVQVTAVIRNSGVTTTAAPSYLNLYDYLAPSTPPTSPADVTYSWCSLYPSTQCPSSATNPLPLLEPGASVTFTADYTLSYRSGIHDLYFLVDGLGGNLGLNWESNEDNNWKLAGSKFNATVLLPLVRRD